jgi:hypothetical protein
MAIYSFEISETYQKIQKMAGLDLNNKFSNIYKTLTIKKLN